MTRLALALLIAAAPAAALAQSAEAPAAAPAEAAAAPPTGAETTLQALLDKGEAEVRSRLGDPAVARREEGGAMWTYRLPACALYIYFRAAADGLRVTGAGTGPRRRGEVAPGVDACLAATAPV